MNDIESNNKRISILDEEEKKYNINSAVDYYHIIRLRAEKRVRLILNKIYLSQELNNNDIETLSKFVDALNEYENLPPEAGDGKQIYCTLNGGIKEWYNLEEIELLKEQFSKSHIK